MKEKRAILKSMAIFLGIWLALGAFIAFGVWHCHAETVSLSIFTGGITGLFITSIILLLISLNKSSQDS